MRTTGEVLESHLALRKRGALEEDLAENYAEDVVLLTHEGPYRGHDGVREAAKVLRSFVPDGEYRYVKRYVEADYAYLEWEGRTREGELLFGWDGFVVREGRIAAQMVHFRRIRP